MRIIFVRCGLVLPLPFHRNHKINQSMTSWFRQWIGMRLEKYTAMLARQSATSTPRPMRAGGGPISRRFSLGPACEVKLLRGHNETKKVEG
jgi:hypothetical protein